MSSHTLFQINRPQVISQTIDGEVVVINLQSGSYYSLTGAAADIWDAVERGEAASKITNTLSARFTDCGAGLENIVDGRHGEKSSGNFFAGSADAPFVCVSPGNRLCRWSFRPSSISK